jgi:hypothetical protein
MRRRITDNAQLDLFDLLEQLNKVSSISADAYYREFQAVSVSRRGDAGYGGDTRAEAQVRGLISQGEEVYAQWKRKSIVELDCSERLHEIIVQLWCIKVQGEVCRSIYSKPATPKVYTPRIDNNFGSRIPLQLKLPNENILITCFESYESNEQQMYHVLYFNHLDNKWYDAAVLFDKRKGKWSDMQTSCRRAAQFRADYDYQVWTQEGFDKVKRDNRLDPQIPAVWTSYIQFYGRDDALKRLGLSALAS